jgi:predicted DNA-binding protein (UPF0251 family)
MRKRNLEEKFSTVFRVADGKQCLLVTGLEGDRRLAENLQQVATSQQKPQEDTLARLFLKSSLNGNEIPFDKDHLCAYLDETCLRIGNALVGELAPLNLTPSECFSSARIFAANPTQTFKNYNFTKSNVQTYALLQIKTVTKEHLYLGKEVYKYSPWGLLRHCTKKKFSEALQQRTNLTKTEIKSCLFALEAYKKVYASPKEKGTQRLTKPSLETWQDIVSYYNKYCSKKNLEPVENYRQIEKWLSDCVKAVREYSKLDFSPLMADGIIDEASEDFYLQPKTEELEEINAVLTGAFLDLEVAEQQLLKLWFGLGISQGDIAAVLGIEKQYQVSRLLKNCTKKLLLVLAKWCAEVQKVSLTEEIINELTEPLTEWLKQYCQKEFKEFLREVLTSDRPYDLPLVRGRYGEGLTVKMVAEKLQISPEAVTDKLEQVREYLAGELLQFVGDNLSLQLPNSANKRMADFVENWLATAPYGGWKAINN